MSALQIFFTVHYTHLTLNLTFFCYCCIATYIYYLQQTLSRCKTSRDEHDKPLCRSAENKVWYLFIFFVIKASDYIIFYTVLYNNNIGMFYAICYKQIAQQSSSEERTAYTRNARHIHLIQCHHHRTHSCTQWNRHGSVVGIVVSIPLRHKLFALWCLLVSFSYLYVNIKQKLKLLNDDTFEIYCLL